MMPDERDWLNKITPIHGTHRFFNATGLAGKDVPPRRWLVNDLIPLDTVTLLSGDGGTGKSLVALQLAVACATGKQWIRRGCAAGRAMFISAEDDDAEIHRRLADIVDAEGLTFEDLDQLEICSLAGEDALFAKLEPRSGVLHKTALFEQIAAEVHALQPQVIVLDTLADLFPGNENDRAQARQFIGFLRGIAIKNECAVVLLAHPSLSGMQSGSGMSGSTGWNNSVRSRLYLHRVFQGDEEPNPDARSLQTMKANYGPVGSEIALTWQDGVFVANAPENGFDRTARRSKAMRVFMEMLRLMEEQGRDVHHSSGRNYAPTLFASHPNAEGITKRAFTDAMERLLADGKIQVAEITRNRRATTAIREVK